MYRKFLKPFLIMVGTLLGISTFAQSYTLTDADVVVTNGVIQSCSANLTNKDVVIPSILDGQTVTGIFEANWEGGVFRNKGIKSVVLPVTIETIGAYSFADNSIESVNFAQLAKLKKFGTNAFENNKLKEVDLSKCTALELIDGFAFNKNAITNINLSGCINLKKIGFNVFAYNQLASVDLSGCTALENISPDAFGNNLLTSFQLPIYQQANTELLYWTDGTSTFNGGETIANLKADYNTIFKPNYTPAVGELTVVNGVITAHKIDLVLHPYVIIPETYNGVTITGIGREAFKSSKLKSIALPSTLVTIDYGAFDSSVLLLYVDITKCSNLKIIGGMAFNNTKFTLLDFSNCSSLETIKNNAFYASRLMTADFSGCPNLKTIEGSTFLFGWVNTLIFAQNSKLETIGDGAFNYCKLKSLDLSSCSNLISIGKDAFANNSLSSFSLPTPTIAGFQGWKDNANKTYEGGATTTNVGSFFRIVGKYTLTDDDVVVENGMIKSCSYSFTFSEITIPSQLDGQTIVGIVDNTSKGVFQSKGITSLVLPNTITYLGKSAFNGNNIVSVNFNELINLESIGQFTFSSNVLKQLDFSNCPKLKLIDNYAFSSNSISSVVFPLNGALSKIGDQAFRMNNLKSIDLSNCTNLKEVHGYAFSYNSFSKFVLPINTGSNRQFVGWNDGTTTYPGGSSVDVKELIIYKAVFVSSYTPVAGDLTVKDGVVIGHSIDVDENPAIVIPSTYNGETITGIGYRLFYQSNLESITLPSTLVSINEEAFRNCMKLTKLDISQCANLKSIGKTAFTFCKLTSLDLSTCPTLEIIQSSAFTQNNISSLNLTNSSKLQIIGSNAFNGNQLTSVNLSACTSLKTIEGGAFAYCPMPGFALPKPTINNEVVSTWVNSQNQTFNSESTVTDLFEGYTAKLKQINVYSVETSIEFGTVDRGKTTRGAFNIFNQSEDTLFIQTLVLPTGFTVLPYQAYIEPMSYWRHYVTFAPSQNTDYNGEFVLTFSNTTQVIKVKANAIVNPNYDIQFEVRNENGALANATVSIDGATPITTNPNGVAQFQYISPNPSLNYSVEAAGYFSQTGTLDLNQHLSKDITLELINYPVNFKIESNNLPIVGATVTLDGYGELITDAAGSVSYPKVLPQGSIPFTIIKNGYVVETGTITVANKAVDKTVELKLITYTVIINCYAQNKPLVGALVELEGYGQQLTDADGNAKFENVLPTDSIAYTISKFGYISQTASVKELESDVYQLNFLSPQSFDLQIQVASNGESVEGVVLDLGELGQQIVNSNGKVVVNNVLFNTKISFNANKYGYKTETGTLNFNNPDSVYAINLEFVGYAIEFSVKHQNQPVSGIAINLGENRTAITDQNGAATFNEIASLEPVTYSISSETYQTVSDTISIQNNEATLVNVELVAKPYNVQFLCQTNGSPLEGVIIEINGYNSTTSDANGAATISNVLYSNTLTCTATKEGYQQVKIQISANQLTAPIELNFEEIRYDLTIICKYGDRLIANASIELTGFESKSTNTNGQAIFRKLSATDTLLYSIAMKGFENKEGQIIMSGENQTVTVQLAPIVYQLTFKVTDGNNPLVGASVTVSGFETKSTNDEGIVLYDITLPETPFNYEIKADKYYEKKGNVVVQYENTQLEVLLERDFTKANLVENANYKVYPNPACNYIVISNAKDLDLVISTISGKIAKEAVIHSDNETIDLSNLQQGVYIVKINQYNTKLTILGK